MAAVEIDGRSYDEAGLGVALLAAAVQTGLARESPR